ncbi:MAG: hypothetical protein HY766_12040 [candidate division NC10 bacterium]|nr:hypothetical protein [candidate division NC10 bacterium]
MDRPIALVVALAQERRPLQRRLAAARQGRADEFRLIAGELAGQAAVLIQAGIGRDRARRALLAAAHRFPFRAAWSLGFAGGLAETLCAGDVVCPAAVLLDDGRTGRSFGVAPAQTAVRAALAAAGLRIHDGPLLTVDDPLRTPEVKRAAHRRTGAVAVDMEAAGVAEAARDLGIPWLAIKAVVDAAGETLPAFLAGCTTARGDLRWRGLLRGLASRRGGRTLWRLHRASGRAARGLQRALDVAFAAWSP